MMRLTSELVLVCVAVSAVPGAGGLPSLLSLDWATLGREVTLRYFSPALFSATQDGAALWAMGRDISCAVTEAGVTLTTPRSFDPALPVKVFAHGFADGLEGSTKSLLVDGEFLTRLISKGSPCDVHLAAWMSHYGEAVSVVLVDWSSRARPDQFEGWDNYIYDLAARDAVDVGTYTGLCLARLRER